MSAFAIFAVVLTFAYAIYYAVVIFMDMTRTEGKKSELEDIDIPGMASKVPDEPPTEVLETENGGYTIPKSETKANDETADKPKSETNQDQANSQKPSNSTDSADKPSNSTDSADKPTPSATSGNTAKEVIQKLQNDMHPIPIESEAVFDSDEMLDIIANGGVTSSGQQIEMTQLTL